MVQRHSARQQRMLRQLGAHVALWRRLRGMTATDLAARAFVTRETLRHIERGTGAPRLDSVVAVLSVLGVADNVITALDPHNSASGRARLDEMLGAEVNRD